MKSEEIKLFRKSNNLTQNQLAELTGASLRAVQSWEQGTRTIPKSSKMLIEQNPNYKSLKQDRKAGEVAHEILEMNTSHVAEHEPPNYQVKPKISEHQGVPYYDVDFVGGFDLIMNDQTINPTFYIDFPPLNDVDCWARLSGQSMSSEINHGDLIALKKIETWRDFLLMGEIYGLVTDEFRTVKRISKGSSDEYYNLIPSNPDRVYTEQEIPRKMIKHLFQVKGSIKQFF